MKGEVIMRYASGLLFACLFVTFALRSPASASPVPPSNEVEASIAVNAFAIDVYRQLSQGEGNVFFSPYSIVSSLAMTLAGARGETGQEMAKTLHFKGIESVFPALMKTLKERFDSIPQEMGVFNVATRLWLDKEQELLTDYVALVEENYGGGVERLNFKKDADGARKVINDWVERKTHDKIKDLLRQGDVNSATRLVLTNAIYFNSAWREPFNVKFTKEEPFYWGEDKQKNVLMMHRTGNFLYGAKPGLPAKPGLQWIKIPYRIPGLALLLLLPQVNSSFTQLEELENSLDPQELAEWATSAQTHRVSLWLPKFKDEGRYALKDVLQKLGMKLAFTEDADFSGMVEDPKNNGGDLFIDSVIHQSFIELDEKGTEAAAASAVVVAMKSTAILQEAEPIEFRVDRPFIYCLMDEGTILFMGRVVQP
jgi:serpin B